MLPSPFQKRGRCPNKTVFEFTGSGVQAVEEADAAATIGGDYFLSFLLSSLTIHFPSLCFSAAILDDPMECNRGERLAITLAKENINRNTNRSTTGKLEVDIFELLRDSEYEMGETSE